VNDSDLRRPSQKSARCSEKKVPKNRRHASKTRFDA
jgi:hypothetical protein